MANLSKSPPVNVEVITIHACKTKIEYLQNSAATLGNENFKFFQS